MDIPTMDEIVGVVGEGIDPGVLLQILGERYEGAAAVEGLQRAVERSVISLDSDGYVFSIGSTSE